MKLEESLREEIVTRLHSKEIQEFRMRFDNPDYIQSFVDTISSEIPDEKERKQFIVFFYEILSNTNMEELFSKMPNSWDINNMKDPLKYVLNLFPGELSPEDYKTINSRLYELWKEIYGWKNNVVDLLIKKAENNGLEKTLDLREYYDSIRQIIPDWNTFIKMNLEEPDKKLKEYMNWLSKEFKSKDDAESLRETNAFFTGVQKFMKQVEIDYIMDEADAIYHRNS